MLRLPRGDDGRFLPILVVIVVVEGGYSLLRIDVLVGYFERVVMFRRGRHLLHVSPLPFFPAKLTHLNLMGCIIGPSINLGLCPDFGPYPSPQPPKHEAQRGEVVIVGVRPVVVIVGCNRPLIPFSLHRLLPYK